MIDNAQSRLRVGVKQAELQAAAVHGAGVPAAEGRIGAPSLGWPLLPFPHPPCPQEPGARTHQQEERETNNDLK